jgi:hypothetical protein
MFDDLNMPYLPEGSYNLHYKIRAKDKANQLSDYSDESVIYNVTINPDKKVFISATSLVPDKVVLEANYPNPFNPETRIVFGLPEDQKVSLNIYSITGEKVTCLCNGTMPKGFHNVTWNGMSDAGNPVSSGIYVYELKTRDKQFINKMILTR